VPIAKKEKSNLEKLIENISDEFDALMSVSNQIKKNGSVTDDLLRKFLSFVKPAIE
jgi:hypothetical protein